MDNLIVRSTRRCLSGLLVFSFALLAGCGSSDSGNNTQPEVDNLNPDSSERVAMTVSRFGLGRIESQDLGFECNDAICRTSVPKSTQVVLTAVPESSWQLYKWYGCDRVEGNKCYVKPESDVMVEPSFMQDNPAELRDDVVLLSQETVNKVVLLEDDYIIFSPQATEISALAVGQVLLSPFGDGFARRITDMETQPGSAIIVSTRKVGIAEIYGEGTLFSSSSNQNPSKNTARSRNTRADTSGSANFEVKRELEFQLSNGVVVKGNYSITSTPDFALRISGFSVEEMKLAYAEAVKLDVEIFLPVLAETTGGRRFEKFEPFEGRLPVYRRAVMVGYIPFIIELEPVVEFTLKGGAKITVKGGIEGAARLGVHYLKSSGFSGIGETNFSPVGEIENAGIAEAEILAGVESSIELLGAAGPAITTSVYAKGEGKAAVTFTPGSGDSPIDAYNCLTLVGTVGLKATTKLEAELGFIGDYETASLTLADRPYKFYEKFIGDNCPPTTPPPPSNLKVDSVTANSVNLIWDAPSTHEVISEYEVYRDNIKLSSSSSFPDSLTFLDAGLSAETNYCYFVKAKTRHGKTSLESGAVCVTTKEGPDRVPPSIPKQVVIDVATSTAIKASWKKSIDNKGDKVYYLIYEEDNGNPAGGGDKLLAVVPRLDVVVDKLQADTDYCIYVRAMDSHGNVSDRSDSICERTNETGEYELRLKCAVQDAYAVTTALDLNTELTDQVNAIGHATDYDGTKVQFAISGHYSDIHKILDAEVSWTFDGESCVRKDAFSMNMGPGLGQDQAMEQVNICGCRAEVNISKNPDPTPPNNVNRRTLRSHINGGSTLSGQ